MPNNDEILTAIHGLGDRLTGIDRRLTGIDERLNFIHSDLTRQLVELREGLRDLWTEHLAHSHPEERS